MRKSKSVAACVLTMAFGVVRSVAPAHCKDAAPTPTPLATPISAYDSLLSDFDTSQTFSDFIYGKLTDLDAAVTKTPRDAKAFAKRGDYYLYKEIYDKAVADYTKAAQLDPKWMEPHLGLARVYKKRKDVTKALAEYDKAISLDKLNTTALESRGDYYRSLNRNAEALADYNMMIALMPQKTTGYFDRALLYESQNNLDKALLDYNKLVELNPKSNSYLVYQGQTLRQLGRTDNAIGSFVKAAALEKYGTDSLDELFTTYLQTKSYDMALLTADKIFAFQKDESQKALYDGRVAFEQHKDYKALESFNKSIALSEKATVRPYHNQKLLAQDYFYRSLIGARKISFLSKNEDYAPVAADVKKALSLDASLNIEYSKRAKDGLATGQSFDKFGALSLLMGVSAALPLGIPTLIALGDAQSATLQSKKAIASYSNALLFKPYPAEAFKGRAQAYSDSARPYETAVYRLAVSDWKSYLELNSNDYEAWAKLGKCQYNAEQTADGIATFRKIVKNNGADAYAHIMLGLGLAIQNDKIGATTEVQKGLDIKKQPNRINVLDADDLARAKSNVGEAKMHYPTNDAIKAIYDLIPDKPETDDEDDAASVTPYYV